MYVRVYIYTYLYETARTGSDKFLYRNPCVYHKRRGHPIVVVSIRIYI